jgi:oxaloacetate decarboxylase alpha subunit/pyruvate carboxylase subunit B
MAMTQHHKLNTNAVKYGKDRPRAANPVKVEDLTLRDGHQSIFATRGRTEDMLAVAELMDEVGFWAVEMWGGATFDTMHRFLNEDPWERIRKLKKHMQKTPFSMLLRGQNLVAYRNYADDVAETFVKRAAENGIDVFRTFDALNDYRNFETVVPVIKKCKKHFQGCICYSLTEPRMGGEVYNLDYYVEKATQLQEIGADSICIKDMAGLISPYDSFELIRALKEAVTVPIHLHSHFTSGMAQMAHLKAIEAGVDIVDCCLAPYAFRTSHPAIEPLVMTLLGTDRDTGFDINLLAEIDRVLEKEVTPKYRHLLDDTKVSTIDINVLLHQTPGGMLSNLVNQLREMKALDRLDEVFETLPQVRKDLGQVPLVTPTSQIVGIQTVNNVLFDEKPAEYKMITDQVKDLCYGLYGRTPVPINKEVQKKALKNYARGQQPISVRPAEVLEPELPQAEKDTEGLAQNIDDVLIYALYPVTGKRFLRWKYGKAEPPPETKPRTLEEAAAEKELIEKARRGEVVAAPSAEVPEKGPGLRTFNVFVDGSYLQVEVEEVGGGPQIRAVRSGGTGRTHRPAPSPRAAAPAASQGAKAGGAAPKAKESAASTTAGGKPLLAPMPGMVVSIEKKQGEKVKAGETVVILEAMKMQNALPAPVDGTIKEVHVDSGDQVDKDDVLCLIES